MRNRSIEEKAAQRERVPEMDERAAVMRRIGLIVFLGALVVRLVLAALALPEPERLVGEDSKGYLELSDNLQASYVNPEGDLEDLSLQRPPGYPLFLAAVRSLPTPALMSIAVVQAIVGAASALLTFFFASRLFGSRAGMLAGTVMALDPLSVVYSVLVLSDTLFVLVLVSGLILFQKALDAPSPQAMLAAGVSLGLTTMVRPVALFVILVLVAIALGVLWATPKKTLLITCLVGSFILPPCVWIARNQIVGGSLTLSTIESENLLYYQAAGTLAYANGTSFEDAQESLRAELSTSGGSSIDDKRTLATQVLRKHPFHALLWTSRGVLRSLVGTGQYALNDIVGARDRTSARGPAWWLGVALTGLSYLAAAVGIWWCVRRRRFLAIALTVGISAYFLIISGGSSFQGRFRLPIVPLIATLAGAGIASLDDPPRNVSA